MIFFVNSKSKIAYSEKQHLIPETALISTRFLLQRATIIAKIKNSKANMDTNGMKRSTLVPILVEKSMILLKDLGKDIKLQGALGPVREFSDGFISITLTSPRSMVFTAEDNYILDISHCGPKVMSVRWNSHKLKDYGVVSFKRGPWIPSLLEMTSGRS